MQPQDHPRALYLADAIVDAHAAHAAPAALLVEWGSEDAPPHAAHVLAAGEPAEVLQHPAAASAIRVEIPGSVLLPAFVNAHTHLDLSACGPLPHDPAGGFEPWLLQVMAFRARNDIPASVAQGVRLALAGGVVAVGDIAGVASLEAVGALRASALLGVSFLELFGLGDSVDAAIHSAQTALERHAGGQRRVRVGLQPHAPYSASLRLYEAAADLHERFGAPLATHLAESAEEHSLLAQGDGPMRTLLQTIGVWSDAAAAEFGGGRTPVQRLRAPLARAPWLVAHVNDADDDDIALLAQTDTTVVYCPRSSAYFAHERSFGPHRYREMLAAGVPVALGTDSVINLPAHTDGGPSPLSVLDEMRYLRARDNTDPLTLLTMGTTTGAGALGLDTNLFTFEPGPIAGVVAVDLDGTPDSLTHLDRALHSHAPPRLLTRGGAV